MYAVYNYKAGSSVTNLINDLVKLATGETNKANLSADCVQANTTIISTVAAGWTVHDADAGANSQVIKCLQADGTTMKYFRLTGVSNTSYRGTAYESWNATSHTGTNPTGDTNGFMIGDWDTVNGGYFYIYVSPRTIFMRPYHTAAWKGPGSFICLEYTKESVFAGYPSYIVSASNYNYTSSPVAGGVYWLGPRIKMPNTTGDYATGTNGHMTHAVGVSTGASLSATESPYCRDSSEAIYVVTYKLEVRHTPATYTQIGVHRCGEVYDILGMSGVLGANLDEITISGKTYVLHCVAGGATPTMLIPKE